MAYEFKAFLYVLFIESQKNKPPVNYGYLCWHMLHKWFGGPLPNLGQNVGGALQMATCWTR